MCEKAVETIPPVFFKCVSDCFVTAKMLEEVQCEERLLQANKQRRAQKLKTKAELLPTAWHLRR